MAAPVNLPIMPMQLHRDQTYYIADGNTVLLAESTLFKVHRTNLIKDDSTFNAMFSLDTHKPDGPQGQEGESDNNPIKLEGDTADEVQALMWAFYALPHEVAPRVTSSKVIHFCNLGRITHKYQFQSIEKWTLDTLANYVGTVNDDNVQIEYTSSSLIAMTELAVLCNHPVLLAAATTGWEIFIDKGRDLGHAISTAERLGLRKLSGLAYYRMMLKGRDHWQSDPVLTRRERIRLLSGFYSITQSYEEFRSVPPFAHSLACEANLAGGDVCLQAFARLWRETADRNLKQGFQKVGFDVLGRLKAMPNHFAVMQLDLGCLEHARAATLAKVKKIEEGLVDFFTDVE